MSTMLKTTIAMAIAFARKVRRTDERVLAHVDRQQLVTGWAAAVMA
jgi:hypothetical protein